MKSYLSSKIKIGNSKNGKGLFAQEKIHQGELLVDYSNGPGKFLSKREVNKLNNKGKDYAIQVNDDLFFAATNPEELEDADFLNHSCSPNSGIKGSLEIIAMKNIEPGEEITIDYAMCESSAWQMRCLCMDPNCRKIITGDDWRKEEIQKKYKRFFSDYLGRKISTLPCRFNDF